MFKKPAEYCSTEQALAFVKVFWIPPGRGTVPYVAQDAVSTARAMQSSVLCAEEIILSSLQGGIGSVCPSETFLRALSKIELFYLVFLCLLVCLLLEYLPLSVVIRWKVLAGVTTLNKWYTMDQPKYLIDTDSFSSKRV